jgi:CheY-like chemotaxis protein
MSDDLEMLVTPRAPCPERPLQGMTILVVEDSRFASEAIRLLCLRSGARIRRADSLAAAHRHLRVYRPSVVIIDLGLPDGSGADLIGELARATPRVAVIIGMSGDLGNEALARNAGADCFLEKPIDSLARFQQAVLNCMPAAQRPARPRVLPNERVEPDRLAFHDDLTHVAEILRTAPSGEALGYIAQFLSGVARSASDHQLETAASRLAAASGLGQIQDQEVKRIAGMVDARIAEWGVI